MFRLRSEVHSYKTRPASATFFKWLNIECDVRLRSEVHSYKTRPASGTFLRWLNREKQNNGRIAQLDRVPGYEPGGRRFESSCVRHFIQVVKYRKSISDKLSVFLCLKSGTWSRNSTSRSEVRSYKVRPASATSFKWLNIDNQYPTNCRFFCA